MIGAEILNELSREKLQELCLIYAKNWLSHDGAWFLAVEEKFDLDTAIAMDTEAWRIFTVIEARRLRKFLNLKPNAGIDGLYRALHFKIYSQLVENEIVVEGQNTLFFRIKDCKPQAARNRKGLGYFPCKSVGLVELGYFAKTIDERFKTEAISCFPDRTNLEYSCIWKFTLEE